MDIGSADACFGGCLCGEIRYEAKGELDFPHLCSCQHCQKISGADAMSWVDFPVEDFHWIGPSGEPKWFDTYPGETKRGFCPECGTSIAAFDYEGTRMGVTIMSLDDPDHVVPIHQGSASNAPTWRPAIKSQIEPDTSSPIIPSPPTATSDRRTNTPPSL